MKSRLEAATPGPWFQGRDSNRWENATEVYSEREVSATSRDICTSVALPEDAELIAHAPTDTARLLAAVKAVVALHECDVDFGKCTDCYDEWPCCTVSAVEAALRSEA